MSNVIDRFNRVDGLLGNSETGQIWDAPEWVIDGGKARRVGGSHQWTGADARIESESKDVYVEAMVVSVPVYVSLILRAGGFGQHWLILTDASQIAIYYASIGYDYTLHSAWASSFVEGSILGASIKDNVIRVYNNRVLVGTYNAPPNALENNTKHGFISFYTNTAGHAAFDNFSIKLPVKVYDGTVWKSRFVRTWVDNKWITRAARRWDGVKWI